MSIPNQKNEKWKLEEIRGNEKPSIKPLLTRIKQPYINLRLALKVSGKKGDNVCL